MTGEVLHDASAATRGERARGEANDEDVRDDEETAVKENLRFRRWQSHTHAGER